MRISPATPGDVAAVADLITGSPLLRRYGVTARAARASLREALGGGDLLFVAREGRSVVGLGWVILTRALDRSAYLRLLLVAGGRQSGGMGAALLDRLERRARAARCRHLVLLVTASNRRARAFYARRGYRHVAHLPGFVRPRVAESLYLKSLNTEVRR